ncbi:MAG: ornithine carbamoyltransferase [Thaumarchaeota archaeon]|nr:ornithine carbamoyltransferase [Nitrososphaerota archaeon]
MTLSKHFLTLEELDSEEFDDLIQLSLKLKKNLRDNVPHRHLAGRTLAMIFQKPSTRTRISFEVGMYQLGGSAINLSSGDLQLSRGESIEDTARTISRYADCIMARVYEHDQIEALARHADVPVINGLSNTFHPCQTLADFATILERKGRLGEIDIAWVGDGNNVCNSMIYGAALSGATMSIATPSALRPLERVVRKASRLTRIHLTEDPHEAVRDADVVVTDTFKSIHHDDSHEDTLYPKYQVNDHLMSLAKPDAIFMHCLPATRDREVTTSVIDGKQSAVWDEAENRLHSQKALLVRMLGSP